MIDSLLLLPMKKNVDKYIQNFDELNVLVSGTSADAMVDTVETLLVRAYQQGVADTEDELDHLMDIEMVFDKFEKTVNKKIDGKDFRERISEYISPDGIDLEAINKVAETEWHRIYQQACLDTAERISADTGRAVAKTWKTVKDDKVRLTHEVLESMDKPLGEKFYTIDGDSAQAPGGFGEASNNINCRCFLEFSYM